MNSIDDEIYAHTRSDVKSDLNSLNLDVHRYVNGHVDKDINVCEVKGSMGNDIRPSSAWSTWS